MKGIFHLTETAKNNSERKTRQRIFADKIIALCERDVPESFRERVKEIRKEADHLGELKMHTGVFVSIRDTKLQVLLSEIEKILSQDNG